MSERDARKRKAGIVVAANRLPVVLHREAAEVRLTPSSGGLVTAMHPVLGERGGTWIGWPGDTSGLSTARVEEALHAVSEEQGFDLVPVTLSEELRQCYYDGFANATIWPLFHDLQGRCRFDESYYKGYVEANRRFAREIARRTEKGDLLWVHDYHLMSVAHQLRQQRVALRTAFFLHIPFPASDIFLKLPWRRQLLRHLLDFDFLGFQTQRDRRNFLGCLVDLFPRFTISKTGVMHSVAREKRNTRIGVFPIGIDAAGFEKLSGEAAVREMEREIRESYAGRRLFLGVDRLDYTKGIPQRLHAFERALERFPHLREKITLLQLVVPSREDVEGYAPLREEIERIVGHINGRFTSGNWVPVVLMVRSVSRERLIALYRAACAALITPLKDGMNLVCKEYCAVKTENDGVLILSEFAGAAAQLYKGALLVNPHDMEGMARSIEAAATMSPAEQERRMKRLRRNVARHDIHWWVSGFLSAASERGMRRKIDPAAFVAYPQLCEEEWL